SKAEPFKKRYQYFQELLASNNSVLETMADLEEKLSGEFLFDTHYIESRIKLIAQEVKNSIDKLNAIARGRYRALYERFDHINSQIQHLLTRKAEIPVSSYIIPFDEITKEMADRVGSKNANLGEIRNRVSLPIPLGFAISSYAFKRFMEHNRLSETINEKLSALSIDNLDVLSKVSKEIQDQITGAETPPDLEKEIVDAYARLCEQRGHTVKVSVRSSALLEDREFSFAGQYSTFLNVSSDTLVEKYKGVIASLINQRALFYYKTKGFREFDMVMSVGVLEMIDARAGGVMYSRDPNDPDSDSILINAVRGLGKCVVDGTMTPETYVVSRSNEMKIIQKKIPGQTTMLLCKSEGGLEEAVVEESTKGTPCLTDEEVKTLAQFASSLENHFGSPQDIEWAIGKDHQLFLLQSRPLRITPKEPEKPIPTRILGYHILLDKGVIACKGVGFGKVHIVRSDEDLKNFPEGAVLVARHTNTKFVIVMNKASALITDVGSTTGHMASLTREYQVPALLDTENATKVLKNGQEITVDAINCNIYEGRVDELIEFAAKRREPFKDTPLFKALEEVLKWVIPLNLVDPEDPKFRSESCETFHDITRFCHEMAMRVMFTFIKTPYHELGETVKLAVDIPLEIYLIDLNGGMEGSAKFPKPKDIHSIPFSAFLKGLMAIRWPEPRAFDVKGFLGVVTHTMTIPEDELYKMGEESFSFISEEYMNFAIRLGYHLSTVEAFVGDSINDNYIRFFFKGGGAALERRMRRVRLMSEILKRMDFNVKITEDVIDAMLTKYKRQDIERKLEAMGKLTVFTKQLDMVMYNDVITQTYFEEFCKEHIEGKI
ncbi:MAG: PEP-utilizing enzyme, partial [Nitrospirota bacterium]|nr:PEP-utilizing enzyme [Nitrospirota bacterium]